jgi:hypothetical protein
MVIPVLMKGSFYWERVFRPGWIRHYFEEVNVKPLSNRHELTCVFYYLLTHNSSEEGSYRGDLGIAKSIHLDESVFVYFFYFVSIFWLPFLLIEGIDFFSHFV